MIDHAMTKPSVKQRPPPYPRPVSEIVAEELPLRPEDVAYYSRADRARRPVVGASTDAKSEIHQRAAKRRRIEAKAQSYLRGEPLYIMSAHLKGPLGGSWKNPWATRNPEASSSRNKTTPRLEIQETVVKEHKAAGVDRCRLRTNEHAGRQIHRQANERMAADDGQDMSKNKGQGKENRIKEWLRTSDAFADHTGEPQGSPTPVTGHDMDTSSTQQEMTGTRNAIRPTSKNETATRMLEETTIAGQERHRIPDPAQSEYEGQAASKSPSQAAQHESLHTEYPGQIRDQRTRDQAVRMGSADAKTKLRVLQVAPPAANLSPFEYRRATRIEGPKEAKNTSWPSKQGAMEIRKSIMSAAPEMSDQDQSHGTHQASRLTSDGAMEVDGVTTTTETGFAHPDASTPLITVVEQQHQEQRPEDNRSTSESLSRPILAPTAVVRAIPSDALHIQPSTTPSEINTADLLPSAQEPPNLLPMPSTDVDDNSMLAVGPLVIEEELLATPKSAMIRVQLVGSHPDGVAAEATNATDLLQECLSDALPKATQEMLAEITPFNFSTAKKVKNVSGWETPITATKPRLMERKKKASFVCEPQSSVSSHGSIQRSMNAKIGKIQGSPPPLVLEKGTLNVSTAAGSDSGMIFNQSKKLFRESTASSIPPKGILKNTNPASSPSTQRQSKKLFSTGQEQVGNAIPIGSGQNAGLDEETFDLDAAIDDLGSFLGTWDVEKEASGLTA